MTRIATISINLSLNRGVLATAGEEIEISLDCLDCQRKMRTVVFRYRMSHGVCFPSQHLFRGTMLEKQQMEHERRFRATYKVEYQYEPFVDAKYPDRLPYYGLSEGIPTWARVHLITRCPECEKVISGTTQSNMVRPRAKECDCGYKLYTDEAPPELTWHSVDAA